KGRVQVKADPAAFGNGCIGLTKAGRGMDGAVFEPAAGAVTGGVEGGEDFCGEASGLFKDGGCRLAVEIAVSGDGTFGDGKHVVKEEVEVAQRRRVGRHEAPRDGPAYAAAPLRPRGVYRWCPGR